MFIAMVKFWIQNRSTENGLWYGLNEFWTGPTSEYCYLDLREHMDRILLFNFSLIHNSLLFCFCLNLPKKHPGNQHPNQQRNNETRQQFQTNVLEVFSLRCNLDSSSRIRTFKYMSFPKLWAMFRWTVID